MFTVFLLQAWASGPSLRVCEPSTLVGLEPQTLGPNRVVLAAVYPRARFVPVSRELSESLIEVGVRSYTIMVSGTTSLSEAPC